MTTSRSNDPRRSLEARYGAFYSRVQLAIGWTASNTGPGAKACTEGGPRSWKRAKPLSPEPGAAAGFFTENCKTKNPVIPAVANKLVLFDFDGAPLEELAAKYELVLPADAWRVRTARGEHAYTTAPPGHPGLKVEVTPDRVSVITDGYLLTAPGTHPSGLQYELENVDIDNGSERPPAVDEALLNRIRELAGGGRERIAELIDSGDPINVNDRHAALMHRASQLRGEGLGAKAIRAALEEVAERFTEPTGRRGEIDGIVRWMMQKPAPPPLDPVDVELLELLTKLPGSPPPRLRVPTTTQVTGGRRTSWTAAELLAAELPEPRSAVEGLLPEGLAFMAGAPKLGKSWLGLGIAIAVASGGFVLGTIEVEQGEVLYLALEDNARRLQSRLRMLLGEDQTAPEGLFIETEWPRLGDGGLERFVTWLDEHPGTRLIVIDVWTRVRPLAHNHADRYQADYEAAGLVQTLAVRSGVGVVALYHTRKAESSDFVETVQGTFGTAGAADTIMVIKRSRGEADATLYVTGRDVVEQELALRFVSTTGVWELLGDAAEYGLGKTRKEILEAVRAHGALTPKQVSELTAIAYETAKKAMQRMFQDGQLQADRGVYTCVPDVPLSPNEGHRDTGDAGLEGEQLTCELHPGLHVVEKRVAGYAYLSCGCRLLEERSR